MFYAPKFLALGGVQLKMLGSVVVMLWNFLTTLLAMALVDRVGRRTLLLPCMFVMAVALLLMGPTYAAIHAKFLSSYWCYVPLFAFITGLFRAHVSPAPQTQRSVYARRHGPARLLSLYGNHGGRGHALWREGTAPRPQQDARCRAGQGATWGHGAPCPGGAWALFQGFYQGGTESPPPKHKKGLKMGGRAATNIPKISSPASKHRKT